MRVFPRILSSTRPAPLPSQSLTNARPAYLGPFLVAFLVGLTAAGAAPSGPNSPEPSVLLGTGVEFIITNGTGRALEIEFDRAREECLEPGLIPDFLGKSFPLKAGESWSKTLWRRNGHGCNGRNAYFWARPVMDGKALGWMSFGISGAGGMWPSDRSSSSDYPSLFTQSAAGKPFTWRICDPAPAERADADKLALLRAYAPRIWLAEAEQYFPSSVEWAFPQMNRATRDDRFWLYAKQELSSPSDNSLPLFKGHLETASVYAFWASGKAGGITDLVYFTFYPYNRGKELGDTVWGNHVGDWESMIVRLDSNYQPERAILGQHSWDQNIPWEELEKHDGHPVVYSAWGSHGLYQKPGKVAYKETALGDLSDESSRGTAWNTWERVVAFDFRARKGLGGNAWPRWMDRDYVVSTCTNPGQPGDPASGPIHRWGNGKNGCGGALKIYEAVSGECILNDGPTGPIDKADRWDRDGLMLDGHQGTPLWRSGVEATAVSFSDPSRLHVRSVGLGITKVRQVSLRPTFPSGHTIVPGGQITTAGDETFSSGDPRYARTANLNDDSGYEFMADTPSNLGWIPGNKANGVATLTLASPTTIAGLDFLTLYPGRCLGTFTFEYSTDNGARFIPITTVTNQDVGQGEVEFRLGLAFDPIPSVTNVRLTTTAKSSEVYIGELDLYRAAGQ